MTFGLTPVGKDKHIRPNRHADSEFLGPDRAEKHLSGQGRR